MAASSSSSSPTTHEILVEQTVEYERRVLRSTDDRYHEFKAQHPRLLERHGITDSNYLRTPNGTGEHVGTWTPPYTQLDIWDYHVNRDWSVSDRIVILEATDPRYILIPTQSNPTYVDPNTGLYPRRLLRLWDFMYNQEYFLNSDTVRRTRRNRKFPTRRSEMLPIIPPYLPDATMPEELHLRYPYAAWETGIYTTSDRHRQAQRYNYITAHSGTSPKSINAYALEPRDITLSLNPLVRPIYRQDEIPGAFLEGYSPIQYGPIVLRNVEAHTKAGWLSLYRQRLRIRESYYTLPKAPRVLDWYNSAQAMKKADPSQSWVEIVLRVLPDQGAILWPDPSTRPTREIYRPPRYDKATSSHKPLNEKETEAYNILRYLLELMQNKDTSNDGLPYDLDVDQSTDVPSAIFYEEPYRILTIQVTPSTHDLFNFSTTFDGQRSWIVSVPPILNTTIVRTLNTTETNDTTEWYADSEPSGVLSITPLGDSKHQVRIDIQSLGEYTVYCKTTRWGLFAYELASVTLTIKRVTYKIEDADKLWRLNDGIRSDRRLWSGIRFSSEKLANLRNLSNTWIQEYLARHWSSSRLDPKNILVVKEVNKIVQFDFTRPLFLAHAHNDRTLWQFVVFEIDYLYKYIKAFGETVRLEINIPVPTQFAIRIQWFVDEYGSDNGGIDRSQSEVTVVIPQQLRWYRAEVRTTVHLFSVYLRVDILWPYPVTRKYMIRNDMMLHYNEERGWPLIVSRPRDLPPHTDPAFRYLVTRPQSDVESLGAPFEGEFFKSLVFCYARDYHVDLQNYARLYPYVQEYSTHMQHIVDASRGRVGIARTLPNDLLALLPEYVGLPLLFVKLTSADEDDSRVRLAYVIYNPVRMRWRNLYSKDTRILSSWNVEIPEAIRLRISWLYKHVVSIENMDVTYDTEKKRNALPPATLQIQDQEHNSRLRKFRQGHAKQTIDVPLLHKETQKILAEQKTLVDNYVGVRIKETRQHDVLKQVRDLFNYFNYICVICEEILQAYNIRPRIQTHASYVYATHRDSMENIKVVAELITQLSKLRSGAFTKTLASDPLIYKFVQKILELPSSTYDYTVLGVLRIIVDVASIKE